MHSIHTEECTVSDVSPLPAYANIALTFTSLHKHVCDSIHIHVYNNIQTLRESTHTLNKLQPQCLHTYDIHLHIPITIIYLSKKHYDIFLRLQFYIISIIPQSAKPSSIPTRSVRLNAHIISKYLLHVLQSQTELYTLWYLYVSMLASYICIDGGEKKIK